MGGTGNDVVLSLQPETSLVIPANTNDLIITDINGGISTDTLTLSADLVNNQLVVSDPNNLLTFTPPGAMTPTVANIISIPFTAFPVPGLPELQVDGLGGNDTITAISPPVLFPAVFWNGGRRR